MPRKKYVSRTKTTTSLVADKEFDPTRKRRSSVLASLDPAEVGKLPPQEPELEQAVLGAALLESNAVDELGFLKAEHFYVIAHQMIWSALLATVERGAKPDLGLVVHELKQRGELDIVGGAFYVSSLTNKVASAANAEHYARIIVQCWMLREYIAESQKVTQAAYEPGTDVFDLADAHAKRIDDIMELTRQKPTISLGELARTELERMDTPDVTRHPTGYRGLDDLLGGGWPAELIVVSARPGQGKTSFLFASLILAAMSGARPAQVFQLELSRRVANNRGIAAFSGLSLAELMIKKDPQRVHELHDEFSKLPVFYNFSPVGIPEIRRECFRQKRLHKIGAVFIDQANWITVPQQRVPQEEHKMITRGLKRLALDLELPVILLHQMNREVVGRNSHRPRLTDLKGAGAYEEDAGVVIFPHRPEYYGETEDEYGMCAGRADIIVAKNSNGPLGVVHLRFDAPAARFVDDWGEPFSPPAPTVSTQPDIFHEFERAEYDGAAPF